MTLASMLEKKTSNDKVDALGQKQLTWTRLLL